jgi:hypothetical protein
LAHSRLAPTVSAKSGVRECLLSVDESPQTHDPTLAEREDREGLPVLELDVSELLTSVVADAEHHVLVIGQQLDRIDHDWQRSHGSNPVAMRRRENGSDGTRTRDLRRDRPAF